MEKLYHQLEEANTLKKEYRKEVEKILVVLSIKVANGMNYNELQKELSLLNSSLELAAKAERKYSKLLKQAEPIFLS